MVKEFLGITCVVAVLAIPFFVFCQCEKIHGPKEIYDSQEVSLEKYKEVKGIMERNPEAVRIYTVDGLQNDEYNLIIKNDSRIETAKVKEEVIRLIED